VEVVNYNAGEQKGLTARAEVIDLDGTVKWQKEATLDSREDSTESPMRLEFPAGLAKTQFIRLTLLRDGKEVSGNFYWHGTTPEDYTGIRTLEKATVREKSKVTRAGEKWSVTTELRNDSKVPALMVRAKVVGTKSGELIAPVMFDDNYIALMPGESRTLHAEFDNADTRGEQPRVVVSGYNAQVEK
jgi:hypothetical protein